MIEDVDLTRETMNKFCRKLCQMEEHDWMTEKRQRKTYLSISVSSRSSHGRSFKWLTD